MKINRIILGVFFTLALWSCKNDKTAETPAAAAETPAPIPNDVLVFTLRATVQKDDSFQLYYKEDADPAVQFSEEKSIYAEIRGSSEPQDIVFQLPKDVMPQGIRFDFGFNKNQSEIVVESFTMTLNDKKFESKGADFFNYFMANMNTVKLDWNKGIVTPIKSPDGSYDPMFDTGKPLMDQINKLFM